MGNLVEFKKFQQRFLTKNIHLNIAVDLDYPYSRLMITEGRVFQNRSLASFEAIHSPQNPWSASRRYLEYHFHVLGSSDRAVFVPVYEEMHGTKITPKFPLAGLELRIAENASIPIST